jgi:hypothetical protein
MDQPLRGRKVAILVEAHLISPRREHWGDAFPVDVHLDAARPEDYHALLLPGAS